MGDSLPYYIYRFREMANSFSREGETTFARRREGVREKARSRSREGEKAFARRRDGVREKAKTKPASYLTTMTLFIKCSSLRAQRSNPEISGLLRCASNDEQRWFASIFDDGWCYVLTKRHFARNGELCAEWFCDMKTEANTQIRPYVVILLYRARDGFVNCLTVSIKLRKEFKIDKPVQAERSSGHIVQAPSELRRNSISCELVGKMLFNSFRNCGEMYVVPRTALRLFGLIKLELLTEFNWNAQNCSARSITTVITTTTM
jgi:hypothetical protein